MWTMIGSFIDYGFIITIYILKIILILMVLFGIPAFISGFAKAVWKLMKGNDKL